MYKAYLDQVKRKQKAYTAVQEELGKYCKVNKGILSQ